MSSYYILLPTLLAAFGNYSLYCVSNINLKASANNDPIDIDFVLNKILLLYQSIMYLHLHSIPIIPWFYLYS